MKTATAKTQKLRQLAAKAAEAASKAKSAKVQARVARLAFKKAKKGYKAAKRLAKEAARQAKFAQRAFEGPDGNGEKLKSPRRSKKPTRSIAGLLAKPKRRHSNKAPRRGTQAAARRPTMPVSQVLPEAIEAQKASTGKGLSRAPRIEKSAVLPAKPPGFSSM